MKKRAFTLVELLVVVAIIALLIGLLLPALAKAQQTAKTVKDSSQIKQIHTAMIGKANETKGGKLPTPGLINRLSVSGKQVPGEGREDNRKNRTPFLYSACVAQQLFNTDILVGPTEVNQIVRVRANYNYAAYNPAADTYWDGDQISTATPPGTLPQTVFRTPINAVAGADECHASYAHLVMIGLRKQQQWRNNLDSGRPHLSTRGCKNGQSEGNEYSFSPTLRLHGAAKTWEGNVCFGDTHMEFVETFRPDGVMFECGNINLSKDNMFACAATTETKEFDQQGCLGRGQNGTSGWMGGDTMLGIHPGATGDVVLVPQYDKLENQ